MSRVSVKWQRLVIAGLRKKAMTRKELAQKVGIDASYVTFMTRDGLIPSRVVVQQCAKVLGYSVEEALLAVGYSNHAIARAWAAANG